MKRKANHRPRFPFSETKRYLLFLLVFLLISCVTINIYFPAAEVEKAAKEITEEVRGLKKEKPQETQPSSPESSLLRLGPAVAYAQKELTVSNASIRQLKARLRARYPKLRPYMMRGVIGEGADGFLVLKNPEALSLRERAQVKRLLEAQNRDRAALYREVMKALGVAPRDLPRIQKIFAKEWQRTAPPGTWIEVSPGRWVRK